MNRAKPRILFADNDSNFLKTRAEYLELEGYQVILINNVFEAQRYLEQNDVDLAILDVRLRDDDDEKDLSGLDIAKKVTPTVPKIILTSFPTVDTVRKALKPSNDGLSSTRGFVCKEEGPTALISAIEEALQ